MNRHPTPPGIANPPRCTHLPSFQQHNISPETHQGRTSPSPPACRLGDPLTTPGHSESRTYNPRGQLTRQTGFGVDISYTFSSTANDGRIQERQDHISGEKVLYQYDQLGRLISAATEGAGGWGLAWNHDGFGNLTQQSVTKGSLTGFTHSVNGTTNRINGQNYDANGNWQGSWGQSQFYDIENRIRIASSTQHQETYLYSARNERIVSQRGQDRHRVHFYGADGLLLGIYTLEITQQNPSKTYPVRLPDQERIYLGGRLMQIGGEWVATDRLGSVVRKGTTNYKYAPYGQEIGGATQNDTTKFATYTRDSLSGLDYALNRYYKPEWGRFTSPDPSDQNVRYGVPGSWNMYAYSDGDPINMSDPDGLDFASFIRAVMRGVVHASKAIGSSVSFLFSTRGQDVAEADDGLVDGEDDDSSNMMGDSETELLFKWGDGTSESHTFYRRSNTTIGRLVTVTAPIPFPKTGILPFGGVAGYIYRNPETGTLCAGIGVEANSSIIPGSLTYGHVFGADSDDVMAGFGVSGAVQSGVLGAGVIRSFDGSLSATHVFGQILNPGRGVAGSVTWGACRP